MMKISHELQELSPECVVSIYKWSDKWAKVIFYGTFGKLYFVMKLNESLELLLLSDNNSSNKYVALS